MTKINTADIGFEKEIWKAADKMRGNIDASAGMNAVQQASMPALQAIAKGAAFIYNNWDKVAPVLLGVAAAAGIVAVALGAQAAAAWIAKRLIQN